MGNPKQKWTAEEEEALKNGIAKHGLGKWKLIQKDPEFHCYLSTRSNIDLKDKWRNMNAAGGGPRDKSRTPRPKPTQDVSPAAVPSINIQTPPVLPAAKEPVTDLIKDEPANDSSDAKIIASDTSAMIFDALAAAKDRNGLDIGSIFSYVEQRMTIKAPQNFRKQLGAKLRRLVQQEKLEKVDNNCYRSKSNSSVEITPKSNPWPRQQPPPANNKIGESLEEAAKTAAYKVAEAEEKSYYAALAVREHERFSKMQEETNSILQVAKEIYDRCKISGLPALP